jgi:uncharacterized protein (AIM24 family)
MAVITQVQVRRGTAAQWTSANPTLASGEWGFETDTGKVKIGDGTTAWTSLAYQGAGDVTLTGTQTLTNKTLTTPTLNDPKINLAFTADTGSSYTAVLTDNGKVVTMDNGSGNTFRIPTNASVAFPIGTQLNVLQIGAGQTTINAVTSGTTTIQSTGGTAAQPKLRARYSAATCLKAGTDLWYVFGDIA